VKGLIRFAPIEWGLEVKVTVKVKRSAPADSLHKASNAIIAQLLGGYTFHSYRD